MANTVLVGLQWGDEGKGKIIDVLTRDTKVIVRYQGGNNAGHTVEIGADKYVLRLIPSGILREGTFNVIGNGLVVDIKGLYDEIKYLADRGIDVSNRLKISNRAHVISSCHMVMDSMSETSLGNNKIGTTKRGIGPAYSDKINRRGLRMADLLDLDSFQEKFYAQATRYNEIFCSKGLDVLDYKKEFQELLPIIEYIRPMICDTTMLINQQISAGENVLFEGAQGTWLDVDFGTYPFVTSSNTTSGGACTGTGVSPRHINHVMGIVKAYTTRVGEGPFMTELFDEDGAQLAKIGHEFGSVTGRPRRCGWLDAVATKQAVIINGADQLTLTKLDVLDSFKTIKICVGYKIDGQIIDHFPLDLNSMASVEPVYEEHAGWMCDLSEVKSFNDLPENAQKYVRRVEELLGAEVKIISVGPKRAQTFEV
ncbi:MAG: adenylosuccinate synthase [Lentisphaeria bacterium]